MNRVKNNYRFNQCPLCTSEAIYCMGKITYLKPTKFSTIEIDLEFVPELWKCKQCLSAFVLNIIQEGIAKKLYTNGLAGDRWSMQKFNQNKMQNVVEYMEDAFNNKCRILDIGSNTGELLDFAKNFGCNTVGLEFSSSSREILINKGHEAYSSFGEIEGKFDFITAFDLVEHLYDVPNFLRTCHKKLSKNGKLVILTGNIRSLSALLAGPNWWYSKYPEHIVFPSIKYFSSHSGFNIEKIIQTFASKGYRHSFFQLAKGILSSIRRMKYNGLPSIGPDHSLIVLRK